MVQEAIDLNKFHPRDYQFCLYDALEVQKYRRIMAIWPRRCLSGFSQILMADGSERALRDLKPGDKIISWNHVRFEEDTVKDIWKTGMKPTLKVQAKNAPSLTVSYDHRFATLPRITRSFRWVRAEDLDRFNYVLLHPYVCSKLGRKKTYCGCRRSPVVVRPGDEELLYDIETKDNHNFVANGYVVHNSGKDLTAWNLCIRQLVDSVKTIYYVFPTFASGRRILWDAITNDGFRILDYLPHELVDSRNEQLMRIKLTNGSVFQVIGSDSYDRTLVGTNPHGVVFSEFALSDPNAYSFVRPILSANGGWVMIISTPRGKSFLYDLYQTARLNPKDWFASKLTIEDTKHITVDSIDREIELGEMSEDLAQQEYYTSFDLGIEGGYYTKYMDKLHLKEQISSVPWQSQYSVHTAWDLGVRDSNAIVFFQKVGQAIHIIDYYENTDEGMEHYVDLLRSKPYIYGTHIAPHDIRVRELSDACRRWQKAFQLGITFEIADSISFMDGVEAVRTTLPRCWFDKRNCKRIIACLENYRKEYDPKRKVYSEKPAKSQWNHGSDAFRYLAVYLPKLFDSMTVEQLNKIKHEAKYGNVKTSNVFR